MTLFKRQCRMLPMAATLISSGLLLGCESTLMKLHPAAIRLMRSANTTLALTKLSRGVHKPHAIAAI